MQLGEIMLSRGGTVDPTKFPDEKFELYSIPAFDRGAPEKVLGAEIGSSKKLVEPGDVLLSRIVPHIRRVQTVPVSNGSRQIASSEWIIFRSQDIDSNYLGHFLRTDTFHAQFMNTVAGVGGSLLRARPDYLKSILIPMTSVLEQQRVARILDHVDALRQKRRLILTRLEELTGSIFNFMFREFSESVQRLEDVASFHGGASLPVGEEFTGQEGGSLLLKVSDMNTVGNERAISRAALWTKSQTSAAATVPGGSVILPKRGASIFTNKKRLSTRRTALDPNLMGVLPDPSVILSEYLFEWFNIFDLATITSGSSVPQLNKRDLAPLLIPVPPLNVQVDFRAKLFQIAKKRSYIEKVLTYHGELFESVQSRAFRGELR